MKKFIWFVMVLMCMSLVSANIGNDDFYYSGDTFFISNTVDETIYYEGVTGYDYLLIDDLNNDGTDEIIMRDGATINVYHNKTFDLVASLSIACDTGIEDWSNMVLGDIDSDGDNEILWACTKSTGLNGIQLNRINFNGTHLTNISSGIVGEKGWYPSIVYDDTEKKGVIFSTDTDRSVTDGDFQSISAQGFSNSAISSIVSDSPSVGDLICYNKAKSGISADSDYDGIMEYYITAGFYSIDNNDRYGLIGVILSGTTPSFLPQSPNQPIGYDSGLTVTGDYCYSDFYEYYIASPLVRNLKSSIYGDEIIWAYREDSDQTIIRMNSAEISTTIDEYPDLILPYIQYMGNMFFIDAWSDYNVVAFGVCGINPDETSFICAVHTEDHVGLLANDDLTFEYQLSENITQSRTYNIFTTVFDGVQDGNDEILTSFGTFNLDDDNEELIPLYTSLPDPDAFYMFYDIDGEGYADIVGIGESNLFFIDDNRQNERPDITDIEFNFCPDQITLVNQTAIINFGLTDPEEDLVSHKLVAYAGSGNVQESNWTSYASSGAIRTFTFNLNKTGLNNELILYGRDDNTPDENISLTYTFNVGYDGLDVGDCTYSDETGTTTQEDEEATDNETHYLGKDPVESGEDVVSDTVGRVSKASGLGTTLTWLVFMLIVMGVMYSDVDGSEIKNRTAVVLIVMAIMLVIGIKLKFIDIGVLLTFVAVIILAIIVYVKGKFGGK